MVGIISTMAIMAIAGKARILLENQLQTLNFSLSSNTLFCKILHMATHTERSIHLTSQMHYCWEVCALSHSFKGMLSQQLPTVLHFLLRTKNHKDLLDLGQKNEPISNKGCCISDKGEMGEHMVTSLKEKMDGSWHKIYAENMKNFCVTPFGLFSWKYKTVPNQWQMESS